ncbi:hypothetical protein KY495_01410 [Massilia sp. PAMC28688]|uniref:hypothetical protein n=1 Tax=Massilia sp. PAMC28688 TaxID=2861283 RepID=UPI001C62DA05|nr:hypothetical protein [Massilia sp. PAMC28688]QYF93927.1 hypothetical protein KY495_01410 [Massilia sp. PAMC28688]
MFRPCLLGAVLALSLPAQAATSLYSDLYGRACRTVDTDPASGATTRRCTGVAGFSLLVHEARAQTSVDIVTPRGQVWPLEFWEVVTPGLARVGRKAEWRVERRAGRLVPTALLVRLDVAHEQAHGPRVAPGALMTGTRIAADGACVVYRGDGSGPMADTAARKAVAQPGARCLGIFTAQAGAAAP